jgi:hypothetical protein
MTLVWRHRASTKTKCGQVSTVCRHNSHRVGRERPVVACTRDCSRRHTIDDAATSSSGHEDERRRKASMGAERSHSDRGGQEGHVMAKTTPVRAQGAVEAHPRGGYQGVIDEGEGRKRYHCPHRHRSEEAATKCLYSVLKKAGA